MARGCSGSDSEEERHDRFRSERNHVSQNASKSLFNSTLQPTSKARSPLRRVSSPSRRDRRSPSRRSRSCSKRRSKERKRSNERRGSKEKSKKDSDKIRRSTSKTKEARYSDVTDSGRNESKRGSGSKGIRRSRSKDKKKKRESRKSNPENVELSDTFLQRFERRRPSVENEIVESTVIYRDSSPEAESHTSRCTNDTKSHKREKKKKKSYGDTEEGELISEEENNCFGPALPPRQEIDEEDGEVNDILIAEGPALPPGFTRRGSVGKALPERLSTKKRSTSQEERQNKLQRTSKSGSDEDRKEEPRVPLIGPSLPPRESRPSIEGQDDNEEALYGPALPPQQPSTSLGEEDDSLIGPVPKGMELDDIVQRRLEERAQSLKIQMENKESGGDNSDERKGRENWMLELPEVRTTAAHLGLGPRKFRTREGPDMSDRSSWTEIAGSKQTKQDKEKESSSDVEDSKKLEVLARNEEMDRRTKETSKHRDKSLLEMHQKELKKKKKKELESSGGKVERRPFSREIDLQSNRFDDARTKSIINKAQLLNSRFASGESKYL